jgi:hypothetical protein
MFNRIALATLAASALIASAFTFAESAQAQQMQAYDCTGKGTPRVAKGRGQCHCPVMPGIGQTCSQAMQAGGGGMTPMPQRPGPAGNPPPVPQGGGVLSDSERADIRARVEQEERDRLGNRQVTPSMPAASAPIAQAPAPVQQMNRVFTAGVPIEVLAADFKADGKNGVVNAPVGDIVTQIDKISSVDVTAQSLFDGNLVDCQEAGVKGKQRFGVRLIQGSSKFVPVGTALDKCEAGQKLYVVKDGHGKFVAIADSTGYLLGADASNPSIKIDR